MKAIVTGAAGFTGAVLTEQLVKRGIEVYAVVRPGSEHNARIESYDGIHMVSVTPDAYSKLPELINDKCDICYHLMWRGRHDAKEQPLNIGYTLDVIEAASKLGCKRFVATGSQAEYGVVPKEELIVEDRVPDPITAYGKAKAKAYIESRKRAEEFGIEWIWARIFSLIGKYEPAGRMLPDLYHSLKTGKTMRLSSCRQNWDYLDVYDAADALIALGEKGHTGEIYNIAHGDYRPLKDYTEELRGIVAPEVTIEYGEDANPFISLQPSVEKIRKDTGWKPKRSFADSISDYDKR